MKNDIVIIKESSLLYLAHEVKLKLCILKWYTIAYISLNVSFRNYNMIKLPDKHCVDSFQFKCSKIFNYNFEIIKEIYNKLNCKSNKG